jgi:hypothetical protein
MNRWLVIALAFALAGCFKSVEECRGIHCPKDAGLAADAGTDGGPDDDDDDCAETDPSLTIPCTSSQERGGIIFDGTSCNVRCFADPLPAGIYVYPSLRQCAFFCALDNCQKQKLDPSVSASATCGALRVSTTDAGEVIESYALGLTDQDGGYGCNLDAGDCVILTDATLGDGGYEEACAATLLPSTTMVTCDPEPMP